MTTTTIKAKGLNRHMKRIVGTARATGVARQGLVVAATAFLMFDAIVVGTPVGDFDPDHEGTHRGSWVFKIGTPDGGFGRRNINKSGLDLNIPEDGLRMLGKRSFLVSAAPAMQTLEFGGYPDPVKKGTFNKRTGRFEIRSAGGFSKQAPAGMIRINTARLGEYVRRGNAIAQTRQLAIRAASV